MNKYKIAGICVGAVLLSGCSDVQENAQKVKEYPGINVAYSQNLSPEDLTNRQNDILAEICYGRVTSESGDGEVTNPYDEDSNYISYKSYVKDGVLEEGDCVRSIFLYEVGNSEPDAIFARFDWKIDDNGNSSYIGASVDGFEEIKEENHED